MKSNNRNQVSLARLAAFVLVAAMTEPALSQPPAAVLSSLQPDSPPAVRGVRWRRVGPELTGLHERYQAHRASAARQAFDPGVPSLSVANDMVVIDAVVDGVAAQLEAALARLGAVDVVTFQRVLSARLPLAAIPELADITALRFARPAMATTNVGLVTSQADPAMRTDDARTNFEVDGSGITVGVLSDTFDCGGAGYATNIGSMDLPGGIEVLADDSCGSDEGRAMAQLIYDVVPAADLSFHTAFGGQADFALGIEELAGCPSGSEAGCIAANSPAQVIVDDVGYFRSPMFQDGIIAQAVDLVAAAGVPYFSSAGNSARASWEGGPFVPSGISPPGYPYSGDAHDFDSSGSTDIYHKVLLPTGTTSISFQWDQPFFSVSGAPGSASDFDLCLYAEPPGSIPIACSTDGNVGGDPVEFVSVTAGGGSTPGNIVLIRFVVGGGPLPGRMKYVAFNSGFSVTDPYPGASASTLFGQNNASGAVAVGAARYDATPEFGTDPAVKESFSSAGGTPILFDTAGARLASMAWRERPQIVAPDGTNNTFFGSDYELDGFPNFFGTSAAAPHAAAVAALMLEASSGLTPKGVEDVLTSSASGQDMGPAGFDFDTGYGLIDGNTAVGSVHPSASCDGVTNLILKGTPNSTAATFSATDSITWGDGTFTGVTGRAPQHTFTAGFKSGNSSSWSVTCI